MNRTALGVLPLLLLLLSVPLAAAQAPVITPHEPAPGSTIHTDQPLLVVGVTGPDGAPVPEDDLRLVIQGLGLVGPDDEGWRYDGTNLTFQVNVLFPLRDDARTNVTLRVVQGDAVVAERTWNFTVDTTLPAPPSRVQPIHIVLGVATLLVASAAGLGATLVWLNRTRGWTVRKFLARHPVQREALVLYTPIAAAVVGVLAALSLLYDGGRGVQFGTEFILVGGLLVATLPYAIDVKVLQGRVRANEAAFAQFLFEMSDALRGGIDPVKALKEAARTTAGTLKRPLRIASDQLRLGKPFEEVLQNLAKRLRSPLVGRYAALLGEASRAGGEIHGVVYRAARDLDDLVAIEAERARQLKGPLMTMYIAFGVLFMMVGTLVDFGPALGEVELSSLAGTGDAGSTRDVPRMDQYVLEQRFFHLLLFSAIGSGLLVGSFTEGKLRHGMVHMAAMLVAAVVLYPTVVV